MPPKVAGWKWSWRPGSEFKCGISIITVETVVEIIKVHQYLIDCTRLTQFEPPVSSISCVQSLHEQEQAGRRAKTAFFAFFGIFESNKSNSSLQFDSDGSAEWFNGVHDPISVRELVKFGSIDPNADRIQPFSALQVAAHSSQEIMGIRTKLQRIRILREKLA